MLKKIALLTVSISSVFAMHTAELNINQYDLEAALNLDVGQFNETVEPDTTFVGIQYLKAGTENASYNDIHKYVNLNFMIKQEIQNTNFKIGLGVKGIYTSSEIAGNDASFIATPLGAEITYEIPLNIAIPIGFKVSAHYAPESLSFSDASRYLEYRAEGYAKLMQRASVYIGYRKIDTRYNMNDNTYDYSYNKSVYFGFRFSF